jgi:hypothetical protein
MDQTHFLPGKKGTCEVSSHPDPETTTASDELLVSGCQSTKNQFRGKCLRANSRAGAISQITVCQVLPVAVLVKPVIEMNLV